MTPERIRLVLALAVFALLGAALYRIAAPFITSLLWALVLVLATWPLYRRLLLRMPRHPGIAAFLMTSMVTLVIILLIVPLVIALFAELAAAIDRVDSWFVARAQLPPAILKVPMAGAFLQEHYEDLRQEGATLLRGLGRFQPQIVIVATSAAKGLFSWLLQFTICILVVHFMYRYGRRLLNRISFFAGQIGGNAFTDLLPTVNETVRAAVFGTVLTAVVQGVLAGIGFALFGAPTPVLFGFAVMVVSFVPFGPPLIYFAVAAAMILARPSPIPGILVAAWGAGIVSTSDNIVRPLFLSKATRVAFFPMLIGVLGGLAAFGLVGIFIGPVIIAVAQALLDRYFLLEAED